MEQLPVEQTHVMLEMRESDVQKRIDLALARQGADSKRSVSYSEQFKRAIAAERRREYNRNVHAQLLAERIRNDATV